MPSPTAEQRRAAHLAAERIALMPREVEEVLGELLPVLIAWYENDTLGEVAILHGGNEWQLEERPRKITGRVKREVAHKTR